MTPELSCISFSRVRAINPTTDNTQWIDILVNTDKVAYVQVLMEGDFQSHFIVGFDFREFIIHKDDIKQLFEI